MEGFTLVEILIVVAIIAIAGMMAIPLMSSGGSMQVRSAANVIAGDLEYAKSLSISRGQKYGVVFDKNNESYQIEDEGGNVILHPVKKGFPYVVDFRNSELRKVDIVAVNFDSTSKVTFDYIGSPYNGNGTPLNSGTISLQAGTGTVMVHVEAVTGYITIQ
jgi:prepilin-type N-terminal cleavage/methylation domain-containing protein